MYTNTTTNTIAITYTKTINNKIKITRVKIWHYCSKYGNMDVSLSLYGFLTPK